MKRWKNGKRWCSLFLAVILTLMDVGDGITALAATVQDADQSDLSVDMDKELTMQGSNSFGNMFAEVLREEAAKQEENQGCNIFSVEMNGKLAEVNFETTQNAELVVGIYDEQGIELLASGVTAVGVQDTDAVVEIDTEEMPEYFYLSAYLIDPVSMRPLGTVYNSPNYTKEMQEFFAKTTEDFAEEKVLNLDEDETNNFVVYSDDTIVIPTDAGNNKVTQVNETERIYTIENIDDSIGALQKGDVFACKNGEEVLIAKVADIAIEGTTATIMGDETSMEEVFSYIKIDSTAYTQDMIVDDTTCEEGVIYKGIVEGDHDSGDEVPVLGVKEGEGSNVETLEYSFVEKKIEGKKAGSSVKLTGGLNLAIKSSVKYYVDGLRYQYLEYTLDITAKLDISLSGEAKLVKIPLATVICPLAGGAVIVKFTPSFVVEVSAKASLKGTLSATVGFSASPQDGTENKSKKPKLEAEFEGEITLFIGLDLEPKLEILGFVAEASVAAQAGVEVTGSLAYSVGTGRTDEQEIHGCKSCVKGEINAKGKLSFKVSLLKSDKLTVEKELGLTGKITDFYYSFDYKEFGWGTCPHFLHKFTCNVRDTQGKELPGAVIDFGKQEITLVKAGGLRENTTKITTNANGKAEGFLAGGEYPIAVTLDGYGDLKKRIKMEDAAKEENIQMAPLFEVQFIVTDEKDAVLPDAIIRIDSKEELRTDKNGQAVMNLPLGRHMLGVVKEGYAIKIDTLDVQKSETITVKMKLKTAGSSDKKEEEGKKEEEKKEEEKKYQVSYTVKSEAGEALSGATVQIKGVLEADSKEYESELLTDTEGRITDQLGAGTYEVTIRMDGYLTVVDELVVKADDNRLVTMKQMAKKKVVRDYINDGAVVGVVTEDGELYTWGLNMPVAGGSNLPIKRLDNVVQAFSGRYETGAITEDGTLYILRSGVGDSIGSDWEYVPVKMVDNVVQVCLEDAQMQGAITEDGSLYIWGSDSYGQKIDPVKVLDDVVQAFPGATYGAITKDGSLYMWGDNRYGKVGNGSTQSDVSVPEKILDNVVQAFSGGITLGAITEDGGLYMWGYNNYGQVGNGSKENQYSPVKVLDRVSQCTIGTTSAAITEDGSLYMWGYNKYGQVGNDSTNSQSTPVKILDDVVSIWNDNNRTGFGAITKDGSLYMWGNNQYGRVGNGSKMNQSTPVKVLDDVIQVVADVEGTSRGAITEDGSLYMWGNNAYGTVGNGSKIDQSTPVKVLDDVVSAFDFYSIAGAITEEGGLYMWGTSHSNGNGSGDDQLTPVKILDDVVSIFDAVDSVGALTKKGSLYMWGRNFYGHVGSGSTDMQLAPREVLIPEDSDSNEQPDDDIPVLSETPESVEKSMVQADFTDLLPNTIYNFYCLRERDLLNVFVPSNFLYVKQAVSDANGKLSISYIPKEQIQNADSFVVPMTQTDLSAAEIELKDQEYSGEMQYVTPVVTLDGKVLKQGEAYELTGAYSAVEVGNYEVAIRGIGLYTGTAKATWQVLDKGQPEEQVYNLADVPEKNADGSNNWQYSFVMTVVKKQVMNGKGTDAAGAVIFAPNADITREEFAQILYNKEGRPEATGENSFGDVQEKQWYTNAVLWAAQEGIVSGYGNGNFGISDKITREQIATMLCKYADYKGYDVTAQGSLESFSDVNQISGWAEKNLRWAVSHNVIAGKGTVLDPAGRATRAEAATMIVKFMNGFE